MSASGRKFTIEDSESSALSIRKFPLSPSVIYVLARVKYYGRSAVKGHGIQKERRPVMSTMELLFNIF